MRSSSKIQDALCVRKALQGVMVLRALALGMGLSAGLAGCDAATGPAAGGSADAQTAVAVTPASASATSAASEVTAETRNVLVMGDSLSAAYNLAAEQGWVAILDVRMREQAPGFRMVNASISGETTAGGASRIDAALAEHRPARVVIELGANDGLRGLPLEETRANLERMVRASKAAGAEVLLVGMRLPPNYGPEYTERFYAQFGEIAQAEGVAHLPFLLEPIAFDEAAFQSDRLHPTAEAQPVLADHVWVVLGPMLAD
jgi:acyl-CoA thioesterase-1